MKPELPHGKYVISLTIPPTQGQVPNSGKTACEPCAKGMYRGSGDNKCLECAGGHHTEDKTGQSECVKCPKVGFIYLSSLVALRLVQLINHIFNDL